MEKKDLKKFNRLDLIELLLEQGKELEAANLKVKQLENSLENRTIKINQTGNIAEAALKVNDVFEKAQKAADDYVLSMRQLDGQALSSKLTQLKESAQKECDKLKASAKLEADEIINNAKIKQEEADNYYISKKEESDKLLNQALIAVENANKEREEILNNAKKAQEQIENKKATQTFTENAQLEYKIIIDKANEEASKIIENANKESEELKNQTLTNCKNSYELAQNECNAMRTKCKEECEVIKENCKQDCLKEINKLKEEINKRLKG